MGERRCRATTDESDDGRIIDRCAENQIGVFEPERTISLELLCPTVSPW